MSVMGMAPTIIDTLLAPIGDAHNEITKNFLMYSLPL